MDKAQPIYYKVLDGDSPCHGGSGVWYPPTPDGPGEWMPPIVGDLIPCRNGYHLCRREDLVGWLGQTIYEAEYRGEILEAKDKVVVREARLLRRLDTWNQCTARLLAADCAEHVVHLGDETVLRPVIETVRRFARGEASEAELDAVRAAARAAWAAERAWQTERLMAYLDGRNC